MKWNTEQRSNFVRYSGSPTDGITLYADAGSTSRPVGISMESDVSWLTIAEASSLIGALKQAVAKAKRGAKK